MPVTRATDAPTWQLPGTHFVSLASPSRGASVDTSVWRLVIDPHTDAAPHHVTRSEVFAPLAGTAEIRIDGCVETIGAGDALVVPADTEFSVSNPSDEPFEAIVCLPVGGQAAMPGGDAFTPEWAA
jgi:mannose-6-phosphate isomerase-like protein (cupin superfamily)